MHVQTTGQSQNYFVFYEGTNSDTTMSGAQPDEIDELCGEVLAEVMCEMESNEKKQETIVKPVAINR